MSNSPLHRRQFLLQSGLGSLALGTLLAEETQRAAKPHFAPSADSIIYLFMAGGPSQVDTFDPKPELPKLAGKDVPESLARDVPRIKRAGLKNLFASHWKFARHGQSGLDISELLPRTAGHADELCVIRSLQHRNPDDHHDFGAKLHSLQAFVEKRHESGMSGLKILHEGHQSDHAFQWATIVQTSPDASDTSVTLESTQTRGFSLF